MTCLMSVFVSNRFLFISSILITGLLSSFVNCHLFFSTIICFFLFGLIFSAIQFSINHCPLQSKSFLVLCSSVWHACFHNCKINLSSLFGNIFENMIINFYIYRPSFIMFTFLSYFHQL